jgi:hypothetical protein
MQSETPDWLFPDVTILGSNHHLLHHGLIHFIQQNILPGRSDDFWLQ